MHAPDFWSVFWYAEITYLLINVILVAGFCFRFSHRKKSQKWVVGRFDRITYKKFYIFHQEIEFVFLLTAHYFLFQFQFDMDHNMDRLLTTKRCLWYMDLRTGGIVLGHFAAVGGISGLIQTIASYFLIIQSYMLRKEDVIIISIPLVVVFVISRMYQF